MSKPWLAHYPQGVPADIDLSGYTTLGQLLEESFKKFADRTAYLFLGKSFTYGEIDRDAQALAAYLQSIGLAKGDRVALMMPNVPQYPVAVAAVLRAGCIVVNVNPLYTARELEHQLKDSGAKAIVILENFASVMQQCQGKVPTTQVVLASMGDRLGLKGHIVNFVVRKVKKLVPAYTLSGSVRRFNDALAQGRGKAVKATDVKQNDVAVLQYTGGTTGVSKGAALSHRNLLANVLQCDAWYQPALRKMKPGENLVQVCALPLYHIFAFTTNMLMATRIGAANLLLPNPRDLPGVFKELARQPFHVFPAVNTLYNAMAHHPEFDKVNWRTLVLCTGGGMAVQQATARLWLEKTGAPICEGYGLSETSPVLTANPTDTTAFSGSIGMPLPSTEIRLLDDDGKEVPPGQSGEIAARGPQVMTGYWQRPDETAKVMTADGFFRTGDIGTMDERGFFKIVDRKKDMILVSGFNVYPNEIEDVIALLPGVMECAAVGVPDERSGEAVKVFIVRSKPELTEAEVRAHCDANLTGYKRPRHIVFREALPKTPVGKVLRRELRDK